VGAGAGAAGFGSAEGGSRLEVHLEPETVLGEASALLCSAECTHPPEHAKSSGARFRSAYRSHAWLAARARLRARVTCGDASAR